MDSTRIQLGELIYVMELTAKYTDLTKATDDDMRELAQSAMRADKIFRSVCANPGGI
jgi:hypothetical protein